MHDKLLKNNIIFKKITLSDLGMIQHIEKQCYPNPWSEKIMQDCIKARYQCIKALYLEQIIGYAFLMLGHQEAQILNITVSPTHQQKGIAKLMLDRLKLISRIGHCHNIILEVRTGNKRAQGIYLKYGFKQIGKRKNYYVHDDIKEDAIVMQLSF